MSSACGPGKQTQLGMKQPSHSGAISSVAIDCSKFFSFAVLHYNSDAIGGSKGDARDALRFGSNFFLFLCIFQVKFGQTIDWHLTLHGGPVWEILDPPLDAIQISKQGSNVDLKILEFCLEFVF